MNYHFDVWVSVRNVGLRFLTMLPGERLDNDWRLRANWSSIYRDWWAPESASINWLWLRSADMHVLQRYSALPIVAHGDTEQPDITMDLAGMEDATDTSTNKPKKSLKIRTANAIFWNYLGLFRDYGLEHIFFRNKTFLFFKIESWNFQHLFEMKFRETSQNFNSIRQPIKKISNRCWKFQLSILKNKNVLFLKNIWSKP